MPQTLAILKIQGGDAVPMQRSMRRTVIFSPVNAA